MAVSNTGFFSADAVCTGLNLACGYLRSLSLHCAEIHINCTPVLLATYDVHLPQINSWTGVWMEAEFKVMVTHSGQKR